MICLQWKHWGLFGQLSLMNCHSAKELWLMIVVTKRKFFSKISTAFDQLWIITPFVIRVKILMQDMWVLETDWDEELPKDIVEKTRKCLTEFSDLRKFKICRCLWKATSNMVQAKTKCYNYVWKELIWGWICFSFVGCLNIKRCSPKNTQYLLLRASRISAWVASASSGLKNFGGSWHKELSFFGVTVWISCIG